MDMSNKPNPFYNLFSNITTKEENNNCEDYLNCHKIIILDHQILYGTNIANEIIDLNKLKYLKYMMIRM